MDTLAGVSPCSCLDYSQLALLFFFHPPTTTTSSTTIVQHCFAFMSWSGMGKAVFLQPEGGAGAGAGGVCVGVDG